MNIHMRELTATIMAIPVEAAASVAASWAQLHRGRPAAIVHGPEPVSCTAIIDRLGDAATPEMAARAIARYEETRINLSLVGRLAAVRDVRRAICDMQLLAPNLPGGGPVALWTARRELEDLETEVTALIRPFPPYFNGYRLHLVIEGAMHRRNGWREETCHGYVVARSELAALLSYAPVDRAAS